MSITAHLKNIFGLLPKLYFFIYTYVLRFFSSLASKVLLEVNLHFFTTYQRMPNNFILDANIAMVQSKASYYYCQTYTNMDMENSFSVLNSHFLQTILILSNSQWDFFCVVKNTQSLP